MKFSNRVIKFEFAGVPMVGNLSNGYSIGLSENGDKLCSKLFNEDMQEDDIRKADGLLASHLIDGGFFDTLNEVDSLQAAYLHVTQRCNLDCRGCYSYDNNRNKLEDPSLNMLLATVKELSSCGMKTLTISGGEPFLRKDLGELVAYAKTQCRAQTITVATNGTILDTDLLRRIRPYVDIVSVSFDGSSESCPAYIRREQRFNQLVELVETMNYLGLKTQILPTLHGKNAKDIDEYREVMQRLGATLNFSLLSVSPNDEEVSGLMPDENTLKYLGEKVFTQGKDGIASIQDAPISMNLSVRSRCGAGKQTISVDADGGVYPCHMLHDENFLLGNVFLEPLSGILSNESAGGFLCDLSESCEECQACSYAWFCGGGCKARSYMSNGKLSSCDPYCSMLKSFYSQYEGYLIRQMRQRKEG